MNNLRIKNQFNKIIRFINILQIPSIELKILNIFLTKKPIVFIVKYLLSDIIWEIINLTRIIKLIYIINFELIKQSLKQ